MDASVIHRLLDAAGLKAGLNPGVVTPKTLHDSADRLTADYANLLEMRALVPASMMAAYTKLQGDMRSLGVSIQAITGAYDQSAAWVLALVGGKPSHQLNALTTSMILGMLAALNAMHGRYNAFVRSMPGVTAGSGATGAGMGGVGTLDATGVAGISWTAILITGGLVWVFVWPSVRRWWRKQQ